MLFAPCWVADLGPFQGIQLNQENVLFHFVRNTLVLDCRIDEIPALLAICLQVNPQRALCCPDITAPVEREKVSQQPYIETDSERGCQEPAFGLHDTFVELEGPSGTFVFADLFHQVSDPDQWLLFDCHGCTVSSDAVAKFGDLLPTIRAMFFFFFFS